MRILCYVGIVYVGCMIALLVHDAVKFIRRNNLKIRDAYHGEE